jgi:hypothetical protein
MKRWRLATVVALAAGMAGCSFENGTEIETVIFKVHERDWQWNALYNRHECIINYPELGRGIYEEGTVLGGVFVIEEDRDGDTYEVLKTLPFVESIPYQNKSYTRTISFDIAPGQVTFYIQASDLGDSTDDLGTYEFKITLVWEEDDR